MSLSILRENWLVVSAVPCLLCSDPLLGAPGGTRQQNTEGMRALSHWAGELVKCPYTVTTRLLAASTGSGRVQCRRIVQRPSA